MDFTIVDTAFTATSSPSTWGIAIDGSVLVLTSIDVFSFGIESDHHGIYQHTNAGNVTLTHSKVTGSTDAMLNEVAALVHIGSSQLTGGIDNSGGGSTVCIASWNGSWNPLSSSCD